MRLLFVGVFSTWATRVAHVEGCWEAGLRTIKRITRMTPITALFLPLTDCANIFECERDPDLWAQFRRHYPYSHSSEPFSLAYRSEVREPPYFYRISQP